MRWLVLACCFVCSIAAYAQDEAEAPPGDESAASLVERGIALREAGQDAEALALFERSQAAEPSVRTLTQIALAEAALGRWLAADQHLREALASDGDEWLEPRRAVLESEAGRIGRRIGSLEVLGSPEGAEVFVDGRRVGTLPLEAPLRLLAGVVRLEVRAEGYYDLRRNVEIRVETRARESAELAPEPAEPEPPVVVQPDEPEPVVTPDPPPERETSNGLRTGGGVALGASALFGALALTMYLVRENNVDTFNSDGCLGPTMTRIQNCRSEYDRAKRAERASAVMLAGAGASAITGIVLFILGSGSEDSEDAAMPCGPGPGELGVSCGARF
ncbi:MAG: PEGA domain-containing protein [Myxococcota bacterium]